MSVSISTVLFWLAAIPAGVGGWLLGKRRHIVLAGTCLILAFMLMTVGLAVLFR